MNVINIEKETILLSTNTIQKLFQYKNWSDVVALYLFYHKQCKLQKTNQSFTTSTFSKKWLWWWDKRFKEAKKILKELNLVENYCDKDEKWIIKWWYIKLNYIKSQKEANQSSGAENHPVDQSTHGWQNTNALSSKTLNALSSKTKMLEENFNLFWKEYPNKKSKPKAEQKYISLLKGWTTHDSIMNWLNKYIKEIKFKQTEKKFIKHPYTWLNQWCWDDEYEIVSWSELDNYIWSQDQETQIKIKQKRVRLKTEFNKEMTLSYAQNYVSILEDAKNYVNNILNTN